MLRRTLARRQGYHHPPYPGPPPPPPHFGEHDASYHHLQHQQHHHHHARRAANGITSSSAGRSPPVDPLSFVRRPPTNTLVNIVPQGETWVVERFGRYLKTLMPGLNFLLPSPIDRVRYVYSSKEQGILIPHQSAITRDNVMVDIDGVLFLRICDVEKASYNIDNPIFNLMNLAQTTMRSEIGKLKLDTLFEERDQLNASIVDTMKREAFEWGVECKRYEIRDIAVSDIVRQSMDLQAEAERRKRKLVLESEGESLAESNRAHGKKLAQQHLAEATLFTVVKEAEAEAQAVRTMAEANCEALTAVGQCLASKPGARDAVGLAVAEKYIAEWGKLAKAGTTVVLSQPVGDVAAFTTQALSMFQTLSRQRDGADAPSMTGTAASRSLPFSPSERNS